MRTNSNPCTIRSTTSLLQGRNKPSRKELRRNRVLHENHEPLRKKSRLIPSKPHAIIMRTQRERDEDAYIARLEAKLGNGKQNYGDALDDLMDLVSGFEHSIHPADNPSGEGFLSQSDEDHHSEEEWEGCQSDPDEKVQSPLDSDAKSPYIPPHRRESPQKSEIQIKLTRQLKGLLNRMSEGSISHIVDNIEDAYRNNPRHDVTSILSTLLVDIIASPTMHLESYPLMHAAFVAALGRVGFGGDFIPCFLQKIVEAYDEQRATQGDGLELAKGKQAANLLLLLVSMYNLHLISCLLVFDIVRELIEGRGTAGPRVVTEDDVELILIIARNCGPQLRTDDPTALKDIVQLVVDRTAKSDPAVVSSRTRFMIETLVNLTNNKTKKSGVGTGHGQTVSELLERMKKFLSGLSKNRRVHCIEPLRIGLADLRSAESKGKWWLVGAAWSGDPLVDHQARIIEVKKERTGDPSSVNETDALVKLARKQGMNTDIRRALFIVLMSSDDYVDACERFAALNLTEVQQREIVKVLVHCCGNEKVYNPYYTVVGQELCRASHAHKITLQFCLWDFLRELGETKVGGMEVIKKMKNDDSLIDPGKVSTTKIKNVAMAYGWWIAKDCTHLSILKPVDFTTLKQQTRSFLKILLTQVFIGTHSTTPLSGATDVKTRNRSAIEEVFIKATRIEALAMGLMYFIGREFPRESHERSEDFITWAVGIAKDTMRTGLDVIPTL